jgi:hypothetical protein
MEHRMRLHENKTLFTELIRSVAFKMEIPEIYVEKDYWITYALFQIFQNDKERDTIFKGGTALAKCFKLIERFSEDIDLVMIRREGESNSLMERKVKRPSKHIVPSMPEILVAGITNKKGMIRKTVHTYDKNFTGDFGQVRDIIVLETTYLGRFEPYHDSTINSYIGDALISANQHSLAVEYNMLPFTVQVLHVNRTLCEKIMSLVRWSYGADPIQQLKDKIRHTYDINQLLKVEDVSAFFESNAFYTMLESVKEDDLISFKTDNDWLNYPIKDALIFSQTDEVWRKLKSTYTNEFSRLVYGKLPHESEIEHTLKRVARKIMAS